MIYGVDPGCRKLALFGVELDGSRFVAKAWTAPTSSRGLEVSTLQGHLRRVVDRDPEAVIFCEDAIVAGARNLQTTIQLAHTVGMVLSQEPMTYLAPVGKWKKETTGNGSSDKQGVSDWLRLEYPEYFAACDGNQDIVDAAAIAVYGRGVVLRSVDSRSRSNL